MDNVIKIRTLLGLQWFQLAFTLNYGELKGNKVVAYQKPANEMLVTTEVLTGKVHVHITWWLVSFVCVVFYESGDTFCGMYDTLVVYFQKAKDTVSKKAAKK